ncbi:excalibur calcium-binding domain-containing protein [Actinoplanes hulinensis]|uniref:Excalibur calcium-binding domain-containing protein n=1 Tax=Actinoplanes hulinensis TaxID=1144547 RepID=A0ABS7BDD5_9ACTN|nr:excalibur calcium-binding domain-containing protein [Actinoplanes hulinensis]MBW6439075.1 excalibur calcium-binding domain-containing protein [Actinoplanes hulinensis]
MPLWIPVALAAAAIIAVNPFPVRSFGTIDYWFSSIKVAAIAVRAAGADPIRRGDPGYGRHLDRDGDGVGCE